MIQRLTREQAAILSAYTGILCGPFHDFHAYAEKIMERPIYTSEFANELVFVALKERSEADFVAMGAVEE